MKAVVLHEYGGIDQLRYEEVPIPEPGSDEVLAKVAATSINPIDWKMRSGAAKDRFPLKFPVILGRDVAGTVVKTGANVRSPQPGQKVIGLVNASYAECLIARAEHLTVLPDGLELENSAALPLVTTTGAQLIQRMRLKQGDIVLVTGAVGSVGRSAVYMAKTQGARVIAGVKAKQKGSTDALSSYPLVRPRS